MKKKKDLPVLNVFKCIYIFNFIYLLLLINACQNTNQGSSTILNQQDLPNNSLLTDSSVSKKEEKTDLSVSINDEKTHSKTDSLYNNDSLDLSIFDNFYNKFHTDTAFQISHIKFPLKGFDTNSENTFLNDDDDDFYWQKKDWVFMHHITNKNEFAIETKREEKSVEEKVYLPNSGFYIIRNFSFLDGKWYLTFYGLHDL